MLVWACIAPHGGELIPELAGPDLDRMAQTRQAMETLGQRCQSERPELLVILTPHGVNYDGHLTISVCNEAYGELKGEDGAQISCRHKIDQEFANQLTEAGLKAGVPLVQAFHLESGGPAPLFDLDWGVLIPLWFMGAQWKNKPSVVIVCPSPTVERTALVRFGEVVAEVAQLSGKRVALIASADQGHGHHEEGPYGFTPISAQHDQEYCAAVRDNALERLIEWSAEWVDAALTDSLCQSLILHGASKVVPMTPDLLSYEAPTYFGMLCAEFRISH